MDRIQLPRLTVKSGTTGAAAICTLTLLVYVNPHGGFDHFIGWTLLAVSAACWSIAVGVHMRDSCVAALRAAENRVTTQLAATLAELTALRTQLGQHDLRSAELIEAIQGYGDERQSAATIATLGGARRNGTSQAPIPVRSIP